MPRSVQGLVDHAILCPSPSDLRLLLHPLPGLVGKDFFPFSQELTMHTGQKKNHMMLLGQLGRPCLYASIRAQLRSGRCKLDLRWSFFIDFVFGR